MQGQAQALKDEQGTELQSQLTMGDQKEVDRLSDEITCLTQQNRATWQERIKVWWLFWNQARLTIEYLNTCHQFMSVSAMFFAYIVGIFHAFAFYRYCIM